MALPQPRCHGLAYAGAVLALRWRQEAFRHRPPHAAPGLPRHLEVGCICAENMEEDYVGPYRREAEFKRRQRWLKRAWRVSRARNSYLNAMRFNAVVFLGAKAGELWAKVGDGMKG
jgi:hypothetical protein